MKHNESCRVCLVDALSGDVRDGASKSGVVSKVTMISAFRNSATHASGVLGAGIVGRMSASPGKLRGAERDSQVRNSLGLRIEFAAGSNY